MVSKKQKQQMKSWPRGRPSWIALGISALLLASCAHVGPDVKVCIVDSKNSGFQCVEYPDVKSFIAFKDGENLLCTSPSELELALKACKQGKVLPITICQANTTKNVFECTGVDSVKFQLAFESADNYPCLSANDYARVQQRCQF